MKQILGLNTLRFFAFLFVFLFHTSSYFKLGYLGVDFFFVLSSFLLTYLALKEIKLNGKFNKLNFFMRRVLRIFPLYFLIVTFCFVALPFLGNYFNANISLPSNKWMYWLFLSNFETSNNIFALKFLWSIAVEEQFYLLFLMFSFLFNKRFYFFPIFLLLVYVFFMGYAYNLNIPTYYHTVTHFANFAIGMLLAKLYFQHKIQLKHAITIFLLSVLFMLWFYNNKVVFHLFTSLLFAALIYIFIHLSRYLSKYKLFKVTEQLGKYSYGLYVYSGFVITFGIKFIPIKQHAILIFFELCILIVIAFASYHLFERFFLQLKKKYR